MELVSEQRDYNCCYARVCVCVCMSVLYERIWTDVHRSLFLPCDHKVCFVFSILSHSSICHTHSAGQRTSEPNYNFQPEFISQNYKGTEARKLFYSQINAHFKTVQRRHSPSNGPSKLIKIAGECVSVSAVCEWTGRLDQKFLMIC